MPFQFLRVRWADPADDGHGRSQADGIALLVERFGQGGRVAQVEVVVQSVGTSTFSIGCVRCRSDRRQWRISRRCTRRFDDFDFFRLHFGRWLDRLGRGRRSWIGLDRAVPHAQ